MTKFVDSLGDLAASVANPNRLDAFVDKIVSAVSDEGVNTVMTFAANLLGLQNLRTTFKTYLDFIPNMVDNAMRRVVSAIADGITRALPGGGSTGLYAGLVGQVRTFNYQNQAYTLWVARPRTGAPQVKVARDSQLVAVLAGAMFDNTDSRNHLSAITVAANTVTGGANLSAAPQNVAALTAAEQTTITDILANHCDALTGGCFAAGSKVWTPYGYRNIEDLQPGDLVWSRNEANPDAEIELKHIEETFNRFGEILHLHFPLGQVIRATQEHPFYVEGRGWTAAAHLKPGDVLRTDNGWQPVEEIYSTGEYETVYNCRVADHHTYFIGEENWGWALWAHNTYVAINLPLVTAGKFFDWTEGSYHAVWFVPNAFLTQTRRAPNARVKDAVTRDIASDFGNILQTKVNDLRTAWNGLSLSRRYGGELDHVQSLLDTLNDLREAAGGTRFSLSDYDNPNNPDPEATTNPTLALGAAWEAFRGARSRARGNVLHQRISDWIAGPPPIPNVGYHRTGPDVDEHSGGQSGTVWYEVYPSGGDNRLRHANRAGMSIAPWREHIYSGGR